MKFKNIAIIGHSKTLFSSIINEAIKYNIEIEKAELIKKRKKELGLDNKNPRLNSIQFFKEQLALTKVTDLVSKGSKFHN